LHPEPSAKITLTSSLCEAKVTKQPIWRKDKDADPEHQKFFNLGPEKYERMSMVKGEQIVCREYYEDPLLDRRIKEMTGYFQAYKAYINKSISQLFLDIKRKMKEPLSSLEKSGRKPGYRYDKSNEEIDEFSEEKLQQRFNVIRRKTLNLSSRRVGMEDIHYQEKRREIEASKRKILQKK
jgi:hypothetical protein